LRIEVVLRDSLTINVGIKQADIVVKLLLKGLLVKQGGITLLLENAALAAYLARFQEGKACASFPSSTNMFNATVV